MAPSLAQFWHKLHAAVMAGDEQAASWHVNHTPQLTGVPSLHYGPLAERAFALDTWGHLLDRGWTIPALNLLKQVSPDARAYLLTDVLARRSEPTMKRLLSDVKRHGAIPAAVQFEAACERDEASVVEHLLRHAFTRSGLVNGFGISLRRGQESVASRLWEEVLARGLLKWTHVQAAMRRPTIDWLDRLLPHMGEPQLWGTLLSGLIGGTCSARNELSFPVGAAAYQPHEAERLLKWVLAQVHTPPPDATPDHHRERQARLDGAVAQAIELGSPLLPALLAQAPPDVRFVRAMEAALQGDHEALVPQILPHVAVEELRQRWGRGPKPRWDLTDKLSRWLPQDQAQAWALQHKTRLPQTLARLREATAQSLAPVPPASRRPRSRA